MLLPNIPQDGSWDELPCFVDNGISKRGNTSKENSKVVPYRRRENANVEKMIDISELEKQRRQIDGH